ncbi:MAG: response regulator transcription factor [Myxococcales bacterium]|nr:response regulator transcription factor [Myxococcales bacterium]
MAILIVEDDELLGRALARALARLTRDAEIVVARTVEEALAQLEARRDWSGFLLDVHLGRGERTGLDVLARARSLYPDAPALVLTGSQDSSVIHRVASLDAGYVVKPLPETAVLAPFARRASAPPPPASAIDGAWIDRLASRVGLSPSQREILHGLARGETASAVAVRTGRSPHTVKLHVRQILARSGARSIASLLASAPRTKRSPRDA